MTLNDRGDVHVTSRQPFTTDTMRVRHGDMYVYDSVLKHKRGSISSPLYVDTSSGVRSGWMGYRYFVSWRSSQWSIYGTGTEEVKLCFSSRRVQHDSR